MAYRPTELLHILTLMFQDGRDYDEVQQEIIACADKMWESLSGTIIETPHGNLKLLTPPLLSPMEQHEIDYEYSFATGRQPRRLRNDSPDG